MCTPRPPAEAVHLVPWSHSSPSSHNYLSCLRVRSPIGRVHHFRCASGTRRPADEMPSAHDYRGGGGMCDWRHALNSPSLYLVPQQRGEEKLHFGFTRGEGIRGWRTIDNPNNAIWLCYQENRKSTLIMIHYTDNEWKQKSNLILLMYVLSCFVTAAIFLIR